MSGGTDSSLRQAADLLGDAAQRLTVADPGPTAFGTGGLGVLGDVGRELHLRWQAALEARSREAAAHAARLHEVAELVARTVGEIAGADADAQRDVR